MHRQLVCRTGGCVKSAYVNSRKCCIHLICVLLLLFFLLAAASAQSQHIAQSPVVPYEVASEPSLLSVFKAAYPNVTFSSVWVSALSDWRITMTYEGRIVTLYWCGSRMLPEDRFANKEKYDPLLYEYPSAIPDPADFTDEEVARILEETSTEVRTASYGTGTFFYDFIYDTRTRGAADSHIIKATFLGKSLNIHEKIRIPLMAVEGEIKRLAQSDSEVSTWVTSLERCDGFNWREIADSGNRSAHALGIAVDILPKGWGQKNLYWQWRRDIAGDAWVRTPLSRRWLIPDKVVEIFEKHGFVYGAKWTVWDNMHLEYKPELLEYRALLE